MRNKPGSRECGTQSERQLIENDCVNASVDCGSRPRAIDVEKNPTRTTKAPDRCLAPRKLARPLVPSCGCHKTDHEKFHTDF